MNILSSNDINILDLLDEILRVIFNKLNTTDIFYSLVGLNQRFDRLALDPLYIHHLDLVFRQSNIHNSSVDVHFPQLHSLSLINYQPTILLEHLAGRAMSHISGQITHLSIEIYHKTEEIRVGFEQNLLEMRLFIGRRLSDLTFSPQYSSYNYFTLSTCDIRYGSFLSSTLTQLRIKGNTFDGCLYLLNGCLQSLDR